MGGREPTLVLCAHGTRDPAGAATIRRIARKVARARPGVDVIRAYVDVQSPQIGDMTASLESAGRACIVVPLLLCAGFHIQVDIASAVRRYNALAADPLGPDLALADLLVHRLHAAGARDGDGVVLGAAGSSRREAAEDAEAAAELLAQRWYGPVQVGYGSAARPTIGEAIATLRTETDRVAVAAYLIGRGYFYRELRRWGADIVTAPLGSDDVIVELVLQRFDDAVARSAAAGRTAPLSDPATTRATRVTKSA